MLDNIIQQREEGKTADLYNTVYDMHTLWPQMVQTEEQYIFLHQCVLDLSTTENENLKIYNEINEDPVYGMIDKPGYKESQSS
ncbi:receptor-type tyrosine-protein phosphatase eta-like [Pelobates fuscus]|uniref:receptor-type tyrosine-protein phosphatase eta-like n=1 Tax=Pelobates fuscus TaxID=191477 RepID=UPI002FE47A04